MNYPTGGVVDLDRSDLRERVKDASFQFPNSVVPANPIPRSSSVSSRIVNCKLTAYLKDCRGLQRITQTKEKAVMSSKKLKAYRVKELDMTRFL